MDWKILHRMLITVNWLVLLVLSLLSFFFMSSAWTMGVILGGLITIANFNILQRTIRRVFSPQVMEKTAKVTIVTKYYFRLLALGAILFVLITKGLVDPVGLAVGLSTVVLSIVGLGIRLALKAGTREAI
jgi:hypothetical protein